MSRTYSAPEWVITDGSVPAAGWYGDPSCLAVLRWWDGSEWTAGTLGPSAPAPAVPGRPAVWLAAVRSSPAAGPMFLTVAIVSALGWAAAATILASTIVTGHAVASVTASLNFSVAMILPPLDGAAALCGLAFLSDRRRTAADRRAILVARRDRAASGGTRRAIWARRSARRRLSQPRFSSLPHPVGRTYGLAAGFTFLLSFCCWIWFLAHGTFPFGVTAGSTPTGQQLNAVIWMVHLITWCGIACRELDHRRASTRMWTAI